jgi:hypothetical protein
VNEERIADAIADLRLELFRGKRSPEIFNEIAAEYDLKPEVLANRVAKAYGSLEDLNNWQAKSVALQSIEARMKYAIHEYAKTEAGVDIAKWLAERAGREPTRSEVELADELWLRRVLNDMMTGKK